MLGLIFSGPTLFAQSPDVPSAETKTDPTTEKATENSPPKEDSNSFNEEHNSSALSKLIKNYNKDAGQILEDSQKLKKSDSSSDLIESELNNYEKAIKKTPVTNIFDKVDLKKMKYSEAAVAALAPFQKLSDLELAKIISENSKNTNVHAYLVRYPKIPLIMIRLIKDKEAIPGILKMIDDQTRSINFAAVMILSIAFGFFVKRVFKREGRSVPQAVTVWFIRTLIMLGVRLMIVAYFYGHDIGPALNVVSKVLFS